MELVGMITSHIQRSVSLDLLSELGVGAMIHSPGRVEKTNLKGILAMTRSRATPAAITLMAAPTSILPYMTTTGAQARSAREAPLHRIQACLQRIPRLSSQSSGVLQRLIFYTRLKR